MITHRPNTHLPWAVCGERNPLLIAEVPTCLWCLAEKWCAEDLEVMRLADFVSGKMPAAIGVSPDVLYGVEPKWQYTQTVTVSGNAIVVCGNLGVLTASSNTLKLP